MRLLLAEHCIVDHVQKEEKIILIGKGDSPINDSMLHRWVRRWKLNPDLCESCKKVPKFDLANISNKPNGKTYTRYFNNWIYLCRRCHMILDGRSAKAVEILNSLEAKRKAVVTRRRNGIPAWNKGMKYSEWIKGKSCNLAPSLKTTTAPAVMSV